jgi:hypothetical protein
MIRIITALIAILFLGCAQKELSIQNSHIPKTVKVIPFANLTQTPLAGYRVASILEGVLKEKNYNIQSSLFKYQEKDYTLEELKNILKKEKDGYIVTGYVNEFKYKAGIDAQPAVSITLKVYNPKTKKYIYTSTISEIGSTYDSLGVITQKALKEIIK